MAFKQHVLTLGAAAANLATALSITDTATTRTAIWVSLQPDTANTHEILIGDAAITTSLYAFRLEAPSATIPPAPFIFELGQLQMQLADLWVLGTNTEKLHVGVIYG